MRGTQFVRPLLFINHGIIFQENNWKPALPAQRDRGALTAPTKGWEGSRAAPAPQPHRSGARRVLGGQKRRRLGRKKETCPFTDDQIIYKGNLSASTRSSIKI